MLKTATAALSTLAFVMFASCGGTSGGKHAELPTSTSSVTSTSTTIRTVVNPATGFCATFVPDMSTFSIDVDFAPKLPATQSARLLHQMRQILVAVPRLEAAAPAALEADVARSFDPWQQYARAVLADRRHYPAGVLDAVFGGDAKVNAATRRLAAVCGIKVRSTPPTSEP